MPTTSFPSTVKKLLVAVTATGVLAVGGASVAHAADAGAGTDAPAAATARHPHVRLGAARAAFAAAAETLGMTPQELRDAVRSGPQSIASVAGDQAGAVTDAIVSALGARLDEAVANGTISAERADAVRARLPQMAERFVHRVPGSRAAA